MSATVDYYLSLQSPWTYLGHQRLLDIADRQRAQIRLKPVSLPVLFPATGGLPLPKRSPQRQAYRLVELERWRSYLNLPLNLHPAFFPVDERRAQGMVVALDTEDHDAALKLTGAMLAAVWSQERDLADSTTLVSIASETGVDGNALLEASDSESVDATIEENTRAAIEANVFGVPNYVVNGEPHWGQDRLDFVERALAGK